MRVLVKMEEVSMEGFHRINAILSSAMADADIALEEYKGDFDVDITFEPKTMIDVHTSLDTHQGEEGEEK